MKRIFCFLFAALLLVSLLPISASAGDVDFLIGDWKTSDGVYLSFYDDGSFEMQWSFFPAEEGHWYAESVSSDVFYIEMDGSTVLSLMSLLYGTMNSTYHFEILKCNQDNFYLVQVYGGYSAKTSPCKLPFTRIGASENFSFDPEPTNNEFQHVLDSDDKDNRQFIFNKGEEFEDLLFSMDWGEYNPRLAYCLGVMARAAYNESTLEKNLTTLGFTVLDGGYEDSELACYKIGTKKLDDGRLLCFIGIQGTYDIIKKLKTNVNITLNSDNWHSGFARSAERIYEKVYDYIDEKTIFVLTGHSLGAATANLLSVKLYKDGRVPYGNLYDYNFACPNVAKGTTDPETWINHGNYANIINVEHTMDLICSLPSNDWLLTTDWRWKRFGQSFWFDGGLGFVVDKYNAHDARTYVDFLKNDHDGSHFVSSEYTVDAISARCPVDVEVYSSSGEPIARVRSGVEDYCGREVGERAIIVVEGDDKTIYLLDDDSYDIRLIGEDDGSMDFTVGQVDLIEGTVIARKDFNSIELYPEKTMCCTFNGKEDVSGVRLFVHDASGEYVSEVLENGTEIPADRSEERADSSDESFETTAEIAENSTDESVTISKSTLIVIVIVSAVVVIVLLITIAVLSRKKKNSGKR